MASAARWDGFPLMAEEMSASRPRCDWEDRCSCREGMIHCTDRFWQHADGPECSEGAECPGLKVHHKRIHACDSRCLRCRDYRAAETGRIARRNVAGDWTTW